MHSCIYEGRVWHRRYQPVDQQFRYRLFMVYLDLAELGELVPAVVPSRKSAVGSFQAGDHFSGEQVCLDRAVRELVQQRTGTRPSGPIRLLTQLRAFGYYFSPLNLFYCFDDHDRDLQYVVAEVSNTPWNERHYYVMWEGNRVGAAGGLRFVHEKAFHVSPFMDMDVDYRWRLGTPGDRLRATIENSADGERFFRAGLSLQRRPLSRGTLRAAALRYPLMTTRIMAAIYYQALRLWMKRCPYYPHPKKSDPEPASLPK
jgi:DUF1365 family protein